MVDDDPAYGQTLTIQGTPHYFQRAGAKRPAGNVLRLNGAQPFELFSKVIDSLLQQIDRKKTRPNAGPPTLQGNSPGSATTRPTIFLS